MPYITSAERIGYAQGYAEGLEEGRAKGLLVGLAAFLEFRFGAASVELMDHIQPITDVPTLRHLLQVSKTATFDEIRALAILPALKDDSAAPPPQH